MPVLITGGCGFIGTNLIARLSERDDGQVIRVFDNEALGKREHLPDANVEFVHGDICNRAAVAAALAGATQIVHLAADTRVMESIANPSFNFETNVAGTLNLLEEMRRQGIKRLINASTGGAILGEAPPPIHEEMLPRPLAPYGASKLAVEGYCSAYAGSYGLRALSLRFSNVFGPRSFHKGSVIATFFKRILADQPLIIYGNGEQVRDYIFVGDLCDGIITGMQKEITGVVQLASGRPVTINELLEVMRRVVIPRKLKIEYRPPREGEILATYCDISKAHNLLDFVPHTALEDGLARTWQWFLAQSRV